MKFTPINLFNFQGIKNPLPHIFVAGEKRSIGEYYDTPALIIYRQSAIYLKYPTG